MSGMWERAQRNAKTAHLVFADGDYNSAINRGYYAIFCAARAALRYIHPDLDTNKTHTGVIRSFGLELVQREGLDPQLGRIVSRAEESRLEADYEDEQSPKEDAEVVLQNMDHFLSEIAVFISKPRP